MGYICMCARARPFSMYRESRSAGPAEMHCAEVWYVVRDQLPMYFIHATDGVHLHCAVYTCTPLSVSRDAWDTSCRNIVPLDRLTMHAQPYILFTNIDLLSLVHYPESVFLVC